MFIILLWQSSTGTNIMQSNCFSKYLRCSVTIIQIHKLHIDFPNGRLRMPDGMRKLHALETINFPFPLVDMQEKTYTMH